MTRPRRARAVVVRAWLASFATVVVAVGLPACAAQLPKAPPPPSTSKGAVTTTTPTTATTRPRLVTTPAHPVTSGTTVGGRATSSPTTTTRATGPTTTTTASTTTTTVAATTTTGPPPAANVAYNADAVASYAVGPQPSNWNIHSAAAAASYLTLGQILAQVWPSAFVVGASGVANLNTSLLISATQVSNNPQTIVYQINPHAVWSNGTPITYRDFAYNWQAQSGQAQFLDVAGEPYTPLDQAGYDDVTAVKGNPANPYTVTVVFSSPYPDWRSLFSYLVPAQIGQSVGFDTGFTDPVPDVLSGGPYLISQLQPGYSLQLVRNALYWGNPANLSSVTYYFTSGTAEVYDALSAGELDVAALAATPTEFQQLQTIGGLSAQPVASASYEDLDFNESAGPFRSAILRQAVMLSIDRASMASTVLSPYDLAAKPVDNRALLPGEPGYTDDGPTFDQPQPTAALQVLESAGYSESGGVLKSPDGKPVQLSLFASAEDPVAVELAALVQSSCAAIGIKVDLGTAGAPAGDVPGTDGAVAPPAGWEMAIETRQIPVFPSAIADQYSKGGAGNVDGYASSAMDALLALVPTTAPTALPALYDEIDAQAWTDFVDLPLVPVPMVVATNNTLLNVQVGPYYEDIAWDEQVWGFPAS